MTTMIMMRMMTVSMTATTAMTLSHFQFLMRGTFLISICKKQYEDYKAINFLMNKSYNILMVKACLSQKLGLAVCHQRLVHVEDVLEGYMVLSSIPPTSDDYMKLFIQGSGGAKKQRLKKDQALNQLKNFEEEKHLLSDEYDVHNQEAIVGNSVLHAHFRGTPCPISGHAGTPPIFGAHRAQSRGTRAQKGFRCIF